MRSEMGCPDIWRPITGLEDRYEVSQNGRVKSLARSIAHGYDHRATTAKADQLLKPLFCRGNWIFRHGPSRAQKTVSVARAVAAAFLRQPDPGEVAFLIDGDFNNLHYTNIVIIDRRLMLGQVSKHPEYRERCRQELARVVASFDYPPESALVGA